MLLTFTACSPQSDHLVTFVLCFSWNGFDKSFSLSPQHGGNLQITTTFLGVPTEFQCKPAPPRPPALPQPPTWPPTSVLGAANGALHPLRPQSVPSQHGRRRRRSRWRIGDGRRRRWGCQQKLGRRGGSKDPGETGHSRRESAVPGWVGERKLVLKPRDALTAARLSQQHLVCYPHRSVFVHIQVALI